MMMVYKGVVMMLALEGAGPGSRSRGAEQRAGDLGALCSCTHPTDAMCLQGGGRKKRDRRIDAVLKEMTAKFARDPGARPALLAP